MKSLKGTLPQRFIGFGLVSTASLALFVASLLAPPCFSAPEPGVRLLLEVKKRTVIVGEPLVVMISLTNGGTANIHCQSLIRQFGYTKFFIGPGADATEIGLPFVKDPVSPPALLVPGDVRTEQEVIHFNFKTGRLAFPEPGQYTLHAEYRGATPTALSAQTVIIVRAPQPGEAEGSTLFGDEDVGRFVAGITRAPQVTSRLKSFAENNRASTFAQYGALLLAEHELRTYADKPANPAEAERLLRISDVPGFPLRPVVRLRKAEASLPQGRPGEALAEIQELLKEHPSSDLKARAETLLKQAEAAAKNSRPNQE